MTTQRDLDTAAEVSLSICSVCGWYDGFNHACRPEKGKTAQKLIDAIGPAIRSGQLGYGDNHVVFEFDDDFHILFEVWEPGVLKLREMYCFDRLNLEEAFELVRILKQWRTTNKARRGEPTS